VDKFFIESVLQEGNVALEGRFTYSSNDTFLVRAQYQDETINAVYKPQRGETPLWDFPHHTLAKREVAAYQLCEKLGWQFVPPTVFRKTKLPLGAGSLQLFMEHDSNSHYFNFDDTQRQMLKPVVLFDLITNNADRKGGHAFVDMEGHLWAIDHGLCFHEQEKLRTVIWDFAGESIPAKLLDDLEHLLPDLQGGKPLEGMLAAYLTPVEIGALRMRIKHYVALGVFPQPPQDRRPFPWPPV